MKVRGDICGTSLDVEPQPLLQIFVVAIARKAYFSICGRVTLKDVEALVRGFSSIIHDRNHFSIHNSLSLYSL